MGELFKLNEISVAMRMKILMQKIFCLTFFIYLHNGYSISFYHYYN